MSPLNDNDGIPANAQFTTTHWSIVCGAQGAESAAAADALDQLCQIYWLPLYAFVRRQGHVPADAQDLTQAFFERLLEKEFLRAVDPRKGRFRSFLLKALTHFLAKEWRKGQARKRGGGRSIVSFDELRAEERYDEIAAIGLPPAEAYDRQWGLTLLEQAVGGLRAEYVAAGKETLFDELKVFLTGEAPRGGYPELASKLGTTEPALKMAVSRLRRRYGAALRAEVAKTISTPGELEEELRALLAAVAG